jgi:hypothetical protein
MKFKAKSENELAEENLLPAGVYPFEVITAEDKQSKAGNDMIALNMRIYSADGRPFFVKDWLMEAMGFKLRHFCEEVGILDKYEAETLTGTDCEGRQGYLVLKQEPAKGDFGPKNSVKDYGKPDETDTANAKLQQATVAKDPDDDLPEWK